MYKGQAIPDEGWSFTRWVVNSQEYNEPEVQLEMVEDIQAKAYFTDEGSGVGSIAAGKLLISPNPAGHTITVSFSEQIEKAEIAIMDIAGNTALVLQNANGVSQYKIDISALTQGIYCLLYTSDAADDLLCVDLGGRRIIKKKKIKIILKRRS